MPPRSISSFTPRFAPRLVYRALTFASPLPRPASARLAPPTRNVVATRSLDRVRILSGQREGRSIHGASERGDRVLERCSGNDEKYEVENVIYIIYYILILYIIINIIYYIYFFWQFSAIPALPLPPSIDSRLFFTHRSEGTWMGEQSGYWEWRKISARKDSSQSLLRMEVARLDLQFYP